MKRLAYGVIGGVLALAAGTAWAQAGKERPLWAYPTLAAVEAKSPHPPLIGPQQLPGSAKRYTLQEAELAVTAADWFPDRHAPMPRIVRDGSTNGGFACGACHMPTGFGHAESSSLVGLTPAYFIKAMREFRSGVRHEPIRMNGIARATTRPRTSTVAATPGSIQAGSAVTRPSPMPATATSAACSTRTARPWCKAMWNRGWRQWQPRPASSSSGTATSSRT